MLSAARRIEGVQHNMKLSQSASQHLAKLAAWLQPYTAAEPQAAAFRARQLQAVVRLTPMAIGANALNAGLLLSAFWNTPQRGFTLAWCVAVAWIMWRAWRAWHASSQRGAWPAASIRALHRVTLNACMLALIWAPVPLLLLPAADSERQLMVATIMTGMMCAGGFAMASAPAAGTVYVVVLGLASALGLFLSNLALGPPIVGLVLIYCLFVLGTVWASARQFGALLMAEAEAGRQNEVIGLLLRDFEEHASDLLWETDANGRLSYVPPRLAALFAMPAEDLLHAPVIQTLRQRQPADAEAAVQLDAVLDQMKRGQAFRDLPLVTEHDGRNRWWLLSAKPLRDASGKLAGYRGVATDVTEAQHANRKLRWMAHFDALTGLANRHRFRERLAALLAQRNPCAVLCLDLDNFKTVNDTLGHAVGDALLKQVALRLQAHTRRSDTVARLGGDEFAVVLHDVATTQEAEILTRRLLEGLQQPCEVQGARVAVGFSVGVAMAPRDGQDIDTLLNHADLALYTTKLAGRGTYHFYAPEMAARTRRRLQLEHGLRDALALGQLSLAYQPQVDAKTGEVSAFEALLRWTHPELGQVSPAEFVPVAESAGLIAEIGAWVMVQACRDAVSWPAPLRVAVNVSPVQAMSADLRHAALGALAASGLAASRLELEITESIFLQESQATLAALHALHAAGLRIALDDFGTGYSSLAYLRRFPFDTLKIDRSFVRELMGRRDARAIVRMIVGLAHTLNMSTVAEGVEDPAQATLMRRYGCDALQGYLVAKPMPAAAIQAFLTAWPLRQQTPTPPPADTDMMPLQMLG